MAFRHCKSLDGVDKNSARVLDLTEDAVYNGLWTNHESGKEASYD